MYDVKIDSLPLADLTESTTPVFCDVCMNKNREVKLNLIVLIVENVSVLNMFRYGCVIYQLRYFFALLCLCRNSLEPQTMSM